MKKKIKLFRQCSHSKCKSPVYSQGLCYRHYMESVSEEETEKQKKNPLLIIVSGILSVLLALIFIALVFCLVEFVIISSRLDNAKLLLSVLCAVIACLFVLGVLQGILSLADRFTLFKAILTGMLVAATIVAIMYAPNVYDFATETVKALATEFIGLFG